jgi:histidinol-phosphate aminotransferase
LHRVKDSFNSYPLSRFAQAGAIAAMQDSEYFEETRQKVIAAREYLGAELQKLGFEVLPSGANFIFTRHLGRDGAELAAKLRECNIIVRHFKAPSRIAPFLRITIGTKNECQKLINALKEILEVSNFQTLI